MSSSITDHRIINHFSLIRYAHHSLPKEKFAVWSSIAVGDVNNDDKKDIVLGLGNFWSLVPEDWTSHRVGLH